MLMPRLVLVALALAVVGCATYNIPPDTDVNVGRDDAIASGTMGVIVRNVVVEDEGGLRAHVGAGEPVETYRAFFAEVLSGEIERQSQIDDAWVGEPTDPTPLALAVPSAGTTFEISGRTPDWVLILRDVTLLRAKYQNNPGFVPMPGQPSMGGGERHAVRNDVEILLWDNRAGVPIATGQVESEETYAFAPSRGTYVAAVGEFVEKLIANTPLLKR